MLFSKTLSRMIFLWEKENKVVTDEKQYTKVKEYHKFTKYGKIKKKNNRPCQIYQTFWIL